MKRYRAGPIAQAIWRAIPTGSRHPISYLQVARAASRQLGEPIAVATVHAYTSSPGWRNLLERTSSDLAAKIVLVRKVKGAPRGRPATTTAHSQQGEG